MDFKATLDTTALHAPARRALARLTPRALSRVPGRLLELAGRAVARAEARVLELVAEASLAELDRAMRALWRVERVRWRLWLRDARARIKEAALGSEAGRAELVRELGGKARLESWERGAAQVRARIAAGEWNKGLGLHGQESERRVVEPSGPTVAPLTPVARDVEFRFRLAALPRRRTQVAARAVMGRALGVARGVAAVRTEWVDVWPEEVRALDRQADEERVRRHAQSGGSWVASRDADERFESVGGVEVDTGKPP